VAPDPGVDELVEDDVVGQVGRQVARRTGDRFEQELHIARGAASVGEVTGAIPIVRTLWERLPGAGLYLTVTTPQGFQFARANLSPWARILPFPLDFPAILERAFRKIQPDLYVALEAEFWGVLDGEAERAGKSLAAVVAEIDAKRGMRPLASALRLTALAAAKKGP